MSSNPSLDASANLLSLSCVQTPSAPPRSQARAVITPSRSQPVARHNAYGRWMQQGNSSDSSAPRGSSSGAALQQALQHAFHTLDISAQYPPAVSSQQPLYPPYATGRTPNAQVFSHSQPSSSFFSAVPLAAPHHAPHVHPTHITHHAHSSPMPLPSSIPSSYPHQHFEHPDPQPYQHLHQHQSQHHQHHHHHSQHLLSSRPLAVHRAAHAPPVLPSSATATGSSLIAPATQWPASTSTPPPTPLDAHMHTSAPTHPPTHPHVHTHAHAPMHTPPPFHHSLPPSLPLAPLPAAPPAPRPASAVQRRRTHMHMYAHARTHMLSHTLPLPDTEVPTQGQMQAPGQVPRQGYGQEYECMYGHVEDQRQEHGQEHGRAQSPYAPPTARPQMQSHPQPYTQPRMRTQARARTHTHVQPVVAVHPHPWAQTWGPTTQSATDTAADTAAHSTRDHPYSYALDHSQHISEQYQHGHQQLRPRPHYDSQYVHQDQNEQDGSEFVEVEVEVEEEEGETGLTRVESVEGVRVLDARTFVSINDRPDARVQYVADDSDDNSDDSNDNSECDQQEEWRREGDAESEEAEEEAWENGEQVEEAGEVEEEALGDVEEDVDEDGFSQDEVLDDDNDDNYYNYADKSYCHDDNFHYGRSGAGTSGVAAMDFAVPVSPVRVHASTPTQSHTELQTHTRVPHASPVTKTAFAPASLSCSAASSSTGLDTPRPRLYLPQDAPPRMPYALDRYAVADTVGAHGRYPAGDGEASDDADPGTRTARPSSPSLYSSSPSSPCSSSPSSPSSSLARSCAWPRACVEVGGVQYGYDEDGDLVPVAELLVRAKAKAREDRAREERRWRRADIEWGERARAEDEREQQALASVGVLVAWDDGQDAGVSYITHADTASTHTTATNGPSADARAVYINTPCVDAPLANSSHIGAGPVVSVARPDDCLSYVRPQPAHHTRATAGGDSYEEVSAYDDNGDSLSSCVDDPLAAQRLALPSPTQRPYRATQRPTHAVQRPEVAMQRAVIDVQPVHNHAHALSRDHTNATHTHTLPHALAHTYTRAQADTSVAAVHPQAQPLAQADLDVEADMAVKEATSAHDTLNQHRTVTICVTDGCSVPLLAPVAPHHTSHTAAVTTPAPAADAATASTATFSAPAAASCLSGSAASSLSLTALPTASVPFPPARLPATPTTHTTHTTHTAQTIYNTHATHTVATSSSSSTFPSSSLASATSATSPASTSTHPYVDARAHAQAHAHVSQHPTHYRHTLHSERHPRPSDHYVLSNNASGNVPVHVSAQVSTSTTFAPPTSHTLTSAHKLTDTPASPPGSAATCAPTSAGAGTVAEADAAADAGGSAAVSVGDVAAELAGWQAAWDGDVGKAQRRERERQREREKEMKRVKHTVQRDAAVGSNAPVGSTAAGGPIAGGLSASIPPHAHAPAPSPSALLEPHTPTATTTATAASATTTTLTVTTTAASALPVSVPAHQEATLVTNLSTLSSSRVVKPVTLPYPASRRAHSRSGTRARTIAAITTTNTNANGTAAASVAIRTTPALKTTAAAAAAVPRRDPYRVQVQSTRAPRATQAWIASLRSDAPTIQRTAATQRPGSTQRQDAVKVTTTLSPGVAAVSLHDARVRELYGQRAFTRTRATPTTDNRDNHVDNRDYCDDNRDGIGAAGDEPERICHTLPVVAVDARSYLHGDALPCSHTPVPSDATQDGDIQRYETPRKRSIASTTSTPSSTSSSSSTSTSARSALPPHLLSRPPSPLPIASLPRPVPAPTHAHTHAHPHTVAPDTPSPPRHLLTHPHPHAPAHPHHAPAPPSSLSPPATALMAHPTVHAHSLAATPAPAQAAATAAAVLPAALRPLLSPPPLCDRPTQLHRLSSYTQRCRTAPWSPRAANISRAASLRRQAGASGVYVDGGDGKSAAAAAQGGHAPSVSVHHVDNTASQLSPSTPATEGAGAVDVGGVCVVSLSAPRYMSGTAAWRTHVHAVSSDMQ